MKNFLNNVFSVSAGVATFMLIAELGVYFMYEDISYFLLETGLILRNASLFVLLVSLIFILLNSKKVRDFLNKPISKEFID